MCVCVCERVCVCVCVLWQDVEERGCKGEAEMKKKKRNEVLKAASETSSQRMLGFSKQKKKQLDYDRWLADTSAQNKNTMCLLNVHDHRWRRRS